MKSKHPGIASMSGPVMGALAALLTCGTIASAEPATRPADVASSAETKTSAPHGGSMATAVRMRVPAVEFSSVALADVFDFMRDVAGLNLYVNWPALEAAGIDRSTPITLKLRQIQLSKVLDLTLNQVVGGRLAWYVSDNIIYITTKDLADRDLITRVYPVQDLLVDIPNFKGPNFSLSSGNGGSGGSSGGSLISDGGSGSNSDQPTTTMQERGEKLVDLIKMLVAPEVWVDNGGFASIRYFNGNLIVTAPRSVQIQIGK